MPKTATPLYSCQTQWCRVIVFTAVLDAMNMGDNESSIINCPVCEYEGQAI